MKAGRFFIVFAVAGLISAPLQAQEEYKPYRVQSGIVEYTMQGLENGRKTIYFDQWGMREAVYSRMEALVFGEKKIVNRLTLRDGIWVYTVDLDKRIATKNKNTLLEKILNQSNPDKLAPLEIMVMHNLGAERIGQEKMFEYTCEVWRAKKYKQTSWFWQGVPLKIQIKSAAGKQTTSAINIQPDVVIPESRFQLPNNIHFIDGNLDDIILSRNFNTR